LWGRTARFTSPLRTGFNYSGRLRLRHQGKNRRSELVAAAAPWLRLS
jgi:hypothetical protein